jgi:hypothetical protein
VHGSEVAREIINRSTPMVIADHRQIPHLCWRIVTQLSSEQPTMHTGGLLAYSPAARRQAIVVTQRTSGRVTRGGTFIIRVEPCHPREKVTASWCGSGHFDLGFSSID